MTPHPVTTTLGATITDALALMDSYSVTILPVADTTGRVCGVVSRADLVRGPVLVDPQTPELVDEVRTPHAVTVRLHEELTAAAALLASTRVRCVPVTDRWGVAVGILSRSDLVHALAHSESAVASALAEELKVMDTGDPQARAVATRPPATRAPAT